MPCEEPVAIEWEDESTAWWWTVWEWLTRKSTMQRINLGLTLSFKNLLAMRCGCMVLKVEEKLMKRIWTNEPVFSRWVYALCTIVSVGSSVLLLCLYTNWYGSKWGFVFHELVEDDTFKTLHHNRFNQEGFHFFWNRTDYRCFPSQGYSDFFQRPQYIVVQTDWKQQKAGKCTISIFHRCCQDQLLQKNQHRYYVV